MQQHSHAVGRCPHCGATIEQRRVLITYERAGGEAMYATCPGCSAVVRPE
ncbi:MULTISPECIES: hypothetical protein [unclassified Halorhabdus]|nr:MULTISPECIES: hypothetical protein [unclassified Halorhabdus]